MSPTTYCLASVLSVPHYGLRDEKPYQADVYLDQTRLVLDLAETPHSYRVKAICLNCKWEGQMRLRKGALVTANTGVECPKCGCGTVTGGTLIASETPDSDSSKDFERTKARVEDMYRKELAMWERRQEQKGKRR